MPLDETERVACEALAARPDSDFFLLRRFLPDEGADRVLALEALFQSLRDIPLSVSDPAVGAAKLAWWQKELAQAESEGSQHPVVRALLVSGGMAATKEDHFGNYLHGLVSALQDSSVTDIHSLSEVLGRTSGNEARLIAGPGAGGDGQAEDAFTGPASAARLVELMKSLSEPGAELRWLPLDLVARHGIRQGGEDGGSSREGLIRDLAKLGQAWRSASPLSPEACDSSGAAFLALRDRLVGRRLSAAARRPARWLAGARAAGPGDILAAWRLARRLPALRAGRP